ncbi:MAG: hypothetical protein WDA16_14140, partial [Candidatus Thermoplasmatota archaeon]
HSLKRSGHVIEVKRGFMKRRVIVPVRVRLSDHEREWLKLGVTTARAILIVSRANGQRITSTDVAKQLGWHLAVARHHLQRARKAGVIEARAGQGYTLFCKCDAEREFAGLNPKALEAVRYIQAQGRRVGSWEIARALQWTIRCAKHHLRRAVKAGLLTVRSNGRAGGYAMSAGAALITWRNSSA